MHTMQETKQADAALALILHAHDQENLSLDPQFVRALLSEVFDRAIEEHEFRAHLTDMVDIGVLEPLGEGSGISLEFADEGTERAKALAKDVPKSSRRKIEYLLEEYTDLSPDERRQFGQEVLGNLPAESTLDVQRATELSPDGYIANAILIDVDVSQEPLYYAEYHFDDPDSIEWPVTIHKVRNNFRKELGLGGSDWAFTWARDERHFRVISTHPLPSQANYYYSSLTRLTHEEVEGIPEGLGLKVIEEVLVDAIDDTLKEKGWHKERNKNLFVRYGDRSRRWAGSLRFTQYPAIDVGVETGANSDGEVPETLGLVADARTRQRVTVADWFASGHDAENLVQHANQLLDSAEEEDTVGAFEVLPERETCNLCHPERLEGTEEDPEQVYVTLPYKKDRTEPVLTENLAIQNDVLEDALGSSPRRPPTAINPDERIKRTFEWGHQHLPETLDVNHFGFRVRKGRVGVKDLAQSEKPMWKLRPPALSFDADKQGDAVSRDPRDIFQYGPYCGQRAVRLSALICPETLSRDQTAEFKKRLSEAYEDANLGTLLVDDARIITYSSNRLDPVRGGLQALRTDNDEPGVVVGIAPATSDGLYGGFKDAAAGIAGLACQHCKLGTAKQIANGSYSTAKLFALQVFLKSLEEDEIPWHLSKALPQRRTLYVGVGYSRYPQTDQEHTSFASITRDDGLQPRWEPLDFPMSPERYFDEVNADNLIEFLSNKVAHDPSIQRVAVLRHGDVYPAEIDAFTEAYEQEARRWDFDFIGLTETRLRLFERDPEPTNPEAGLLYVPAEDRCLLSMSTLPGDTVPEGSVRLLEARRALGQTPIEDIGREIYDQAFLNWGSPAKPPKDPLPVDLAEKMARLATRVNNPRVFEHFPL